MNTEQSVEIVKAAFSHLICDENISIGEAKALLYFPSIGIGIFEAEHEIEERRIQSILAAQPAYPAEKICPIFINAKKENFNVGHVIQDILLEAGFVPGTGN